MECKIKQFLSKLFKQEAKAEPIAEAVQAVPVAEAPEKAPAGTKPTPPATQEPDPKIKHNMGDGYYIAYDQVPNGYGGYHEVDMRLYRDGKLIRKITDERGFFLDFPGVVHGSWEYDVKGKFVPQVRFVNSIYPFGEDGLADFRWMVQPDGRYWADDDGFGMENDIEINLVSKLNKEGRFVTPFSKSR